MKNKNENWRVKNGGMEVAKVHSVQIYFGRYIIHSHTYTETLISLQLTLDIVKVANAYFLYTQDIIRFLLGKCYIFSFHPFSVVSTHFPAQLLLSSCC